MSLTSQGSAGLGGPRGLGDTITVQAVAMLLGSDVHRGEPGDGRAPAWRAQPAGQGQGNEHHAGGAGLRQRRGRNRGISVPTSLFRRQP